MALRSRMVQFEEKYNYVSGWCTVDVLLEMGK